MGEILMIINSVFNANRDELNFTVPYYYQSNDREIKQNYQRSLEENRRPTIKLSKVIENYNKNMIHRGAGFHKKRGC